MAVVEPVTPAAQHPLDPRRALEAIAGDPDGREKIGFGALLLALPIVNVAAVGYEVEVTRRVARGEPQPLPRWGGLGEYFKLGLPLALARLVYALPAAALVVATIGLLLRLGAWATSPAAPADPVALAGAVLLRFFTYGAGLAVLWMINGLVYSFISPAILAQYARRGTFGACFGWRAMAGLIRRHRRPYFRLWLLEWADGLVVSLILGGSGLVLGAIPCVGWLGNLGLALILSFTSMLVDGHLAGQLLQLENT